ncbi:putative ribonuclease H-like domain-containing protein [Tanacetum coccineum]
MDLDSNQNNAVAKIPLLKQGDYDMWRIKIEQYFQIQDYALWEVIQYGDSVKPTTRVIANKDGTSTSTTITNPVTTEEKLQKKNDLKARSMLLMTLPNEHLLTFSQYKDAKTLASSGELLDSIFNRLPKIISQLACLGENISQDEQNFKFLRSLPDEWNTHVVVWRNKPDLGHTKYINTDSVQVNTSSTSASTSIVIAANIGDATVYAFLSSQPNGSSIAYEDLDQIHDDDLEEMVLKWNLTLLSMRARKFYQRTRRKIAIEGSDTAGYDKSKVECYNCHKMGHFARECRSARNHNNRAKNQDNRSQEGPKKTEAPTNMALIAFSDSEVLNDKTCSNSCLKNYETLKNKYDNLRVELNKSNYDLANYKKGLAYVEEQLVFYKKNKVALCDQIAVLKRDASFKDSEINALKIQVENLKKKKESIKIKVDGFEFASKNLDTLVGSQISVNKKRGLKEFQQPEFLGYGDKVNEKVSEKSPNETKKNSNAPIIEDWVSDCDEEISVFREIENVQTKPKQANETRKINEVPRNNSPSWNKPMPNKLGGTGQREVRPVWNNAMRTNHQNFSNTRRNFVPKAVLTKSGNVLISTGGQNSLRTWVPVSTTRPINTGPPKTFEKKCQVLLGGSGINVVKSSAYWVWRPKEKVIDHVSKNSGSYICKRFNYVDPTARSKYMTGNKSYLTDYEDHDGGFVAFAGSSKGGIITSKGKIKTEHLDFEDVYFVKELKFNPFSVSQMCDKKNSVLFTETKCLILSPEFKLPDENQVMLKIHRKDNMYSFDLKNIVPSKGLTCLIAKATNDESKMWHRRLGHINFKTMNKLVKGNLVRGLPSKFFENNHTCVACQEGKQHKASSKKDETSSILKNFITGIENQLNHKVKVIGCDNGTGFKNYEMNQFCGIKGIKKEFSNARTPQQNGVAERKNRTLIEAARTMLADSLLPIPFWAEVVNTACYVQNRVLVTKPHNKTPYELLLGRTPAVSFMRPFGCPVTILNTLDHLGKFDGKADEGFLVGYSINSKAFRVFNSRTRKVEENLHVNFLENKPNVAGGGPQWLFDIDILTNTINYHPVSAGNRTNGNAGLEINPDAGSAGKEKVPDQQYILLPLMHTSSYIPSSSNEDKSSPEDDAGKKNEVKEPAKEDDLNDSGEDTNADRTNRINTGSSPLNSDKNAAIPSSYPDDPLMPELEDIDTPYNTSIFENAYDDKDVGAEADMNNLDSSINTEPKKVTEALEEESWAEVMQEELL